MDQSPIDLNDIEALERHLAALKAKQAGATRSDSGGGAVVGKSVRVRGGHFIGRDFIQTLNH